MLFVGYDTAEPGQPRSSTASHLPPSSSLPSSRPPPRPLPRIDPLHPPPPTLDLDSISSSLHSLYTRALHHLPSHPSLALPLLRQLLSHFLYHPLNRLSPHQPPPPPSHPSHPPLPPRLLHLHFLALHQLASLHHQQGEPNVALQCWSFTSLSSPPLSPSTASVVVPVRLALARCAMRVGELALARGVLEEVVEGVGVEGGGWEVVDMLMDVLYVIGDHHALLSLARHALQRDRRYVKALLIYTQLHPLSLLTPSSSTFHQRCAEELQRVPFSVVQSVAAGMLRLSASMPSVAEVAQVPGGHEVRLTSMTAAALGEALLQTYVEAKRRRKEVGESGLVVPTFSSLHRLLRWVKDRHAAQRAEKKRADIFILASSATSSTAASISLSTPISVTGPDGPAPAVAEASSGRENREEAKRQQRREACSRALRSGLLGATSLDGIVSTLPIDVPSPSNVAQPPQPSSARSVPLYFPPPPPSSLSSFIASHASSASSNDGVVDLMHRYLRFVRLTRPRGLPSELLARLVLAVEEHRTAEAEDDGEDVLFAAAALLDCLAAPPYAEPPPSVTGPALSALWSRLSLLAVGRMSRQPEDHEGQRTEPEESFAMLPE